ncbi:MAG: uroporphyrinogen decarboxylase family protein, partial [Lentisphaerae bacterium]|nr:uroporphyrinogen decarboxylase family protein [Lentisphaerota bacterium]
FFIPQRTTRVDANALYEIDDRGRDIGQIDLEGGWATHLQRAEDFRLDDPHDIAFRAFRKHEAPRVNSPSEAARIAVPDRAFWEAATAKQLSAAQAHAAGRIALIGDCNTATLGWYIDFRGMQQAMFDLIEQPALVHAVMEKGVEYAIERGKFCIDHGLCILRLNDSVANMSVISPATWREFIRPHMTEICDELHNYAPDTRIYCHICGNILPVIEDLAGTGLDCIGPLDPLGGFSVAEARARVGTEMILLGGVNTLDFINADPAQIKEQARACIRAGQVRGSRYILSSGCVVPPGARKENLLALRRAAELEACTFQNVSN